MISDIVNEGRIAKLRLHRRNPQIVRALKSNIRGMVLRDCSAKEIALNVDLSAGKACRWIHVLGFRRMYVTAEERAHLLERRAGR